MKQLALITDPVFAGAGRYNALDRFFLSLIRDERDLPFIYLTLKISLVMIPVGLSMYFLSGWLWWAAAVAYFYLNNVVFKGPFGLMLHCTSHRKFFKPEYEAFNNYLPWVVGPFFGQTPETYYSHHIHMHHAENNLPEDLSTTMFYQRDSFRDFLKYFGSFMTVGLKNLFSYFRKNNRPNLARKILIGEAAFILLCVMLSIVNLAATFMVFILPFLISRFVMMLGNWSQHAFIDATDPGNPYKNSITCINHKYNHKCWNDGYHISHHQKPHMHWTQHPVYFRKTLDEYAENKAIVFDNLDFLRVFILLMQKKYDRLADHVVNINSTFGSRQEAVALLKERTRRIRY
jgi:fatty acid desaturase